MTRTATIRVCLLTALAAVTGCSSSEPSRYAATGTVTLDGKPTRSVVVSFRPVSGDPKSGGAGTTDPSGRFAIGEDGKNSGLPAGDYKVTFSLTTVGGKPTLSGSGGKAGEKVASEKEVVADDYRNPEKTPATATVGRGPNNFNFEVKSKP